VYAEPPKTGRRHFLIEFDERSIYLDPVLDVCREKQIAIACSYASDILLVCIAARLLKRGFERLPMWL
jgi:hypothetical protein